MVDFLQPVYLKRFCFILKFNVVYSVFCFECIFYLNRVDISIWFLSKHFYSSPHATKQVVSSLITSHQYGMYFKRYSHAAIVGSLPLRYIKNRFLGFLSLSLYHCPICSMINFKLIRTINKEWLLIKLFNKRFFDKIPEKKTCLDKTFFLILIDIILP